MRRPEGKSFAGCIDDGLDHAGVAVTQDGGPPRADVVDVLSIIDIPDVRPKAAAQHERRATDGPGSADGAVHASRKETLSTLDEGVRASRDSHRCHQGAPRRVTISSNGRWMPSRIGLSLTVARRLSVLRRARTRSPNATRSSVS